MGLKVHNTLTRKVEEFKPLSQGRVGIYVCGPTVYGHAHLGHAKSYVSFDILVRYLRYLGYAVTYVQNITDVGHLTDDADEGEDKLAVAARKEKKHPMALAEYYTLTSEERAALASGDIKKIEDWVGKLDDRLATWLWCRLSQEKW